MINDTLSIYQSIKEIYIAPWSKTNFVLRRFTERHKKYNKTHESKMKYSWLDTQVKIDGVSRVSWKCLLIQHIWYVPVIDSKFSDHSMKRICQQRLSTGCEVLQNDVKTMNWSVAVWHWTVLEAYLICIEVSDGEWIWRQEQELWSQCAAWLVANEVQWDQRWQDRTCAFL